MGPYQRIKDLGYIIDKYGYPREVCGHVCDRTVLVDMLLKRVEQTKVFAAVMQTLLDYGTVKGPLSDSNDRQLGCIFRRWASEGLVSLSPAQQMMVNSIKYKGRQKRSDANG